MNRFIRDERGTLLVVFALLLPIMVVCAGMVVDVGRFLVTRAKLQTIVDASSLAAVSTARVVEERQLEMEKNDAGEPVLIRERVVKREIAINPLAAWGKANEAAKLNGAVPGPWLAFDDYYEGPLGPGQTGWAGEQHGNDSYEVQMRVKTAPGFLRVLFGDSVSVYAEGRAQAFIPKN